MAQKPKISVRILKIDIERSPLYIIIKLLLFYVGFLSTGDANAPGNAGLKDQVEVLKWIKDNIINFGGCPNRVTLFGVSSGAAAVQFHMMSPMSRGNVNRLNIYFETVHFINYNTDTYIL